MPRGTGTPNLRKISLPWYSWIFTSSPVPLTPSSDTTADSSGAPFRSSSRARGSDRAGTACRRRPASSRIAARERLHGGRRQRAEHLGDVRAAAHAAHRVVQPLCRNPAPGSRRRARGTRARSSSQPPGYGTRSVDASMSTIVNAAVDRHAHPHVVHRLAGRAHARQQVVVVVLDVDQVRLDVEQSRRRAAAFVAPRRGRGRVGWRRLAHRPAGGEPAAAAAAQCAQTLILRDRLRAPQRSVSVK